MARKHNHDARGFIPPNILGAAARVVQQSGSGDLRCRHSSPGRMGALFDRASPAKIHRSIKISRGD
jgi:hypothetical protein